ncbi:MAG: EAL domain-containing protein, partial [Solobacterium sp.]|nr:EAL domain-containing protein [Solobacterium sp.]
LGFVIHNYTDAREIYGTTQMDQGISLITEYLAYTFPKYYRFYLRNGCFALFGDETMDWDAIPKTIQERFQSHWKADEADLFLNISFVRVSSVSPHDDTDTIINRLYSAFNEAGRKNGSDLVIDLDQIHDVDRQVDVKRTLEHCIEKDAVEIFLQPLIDSSNNEMVGAEVLARIRHEDGHIIPPGIFIPIAEQNGQINRLGAQVFEKACRFIHDGFLAETGMKWLNVNLSPVQCMKKDLAAEFGAILRKYDVGADQIRLEITEASMIDFSLLQRQITELRSNGFQFALDDYGSGYSNLTRVKHYPFINIKLDMEVVWDYIRDRDLLLPAIVSAFKQLKFSVTAEGIESADMADAMKDIGCDYLQGYYFSQPMPVEDFLRKYRIIPSA